MEYVLINLEKDLVGAFIFSLNVETSTVPYILSAAVDSISRSSSPSASSKGRPISVSDIRWPVTNHRMFRRNNAVPCRTCTSNLT